MSAMSDVTLNDGLPTPVAHVFSGVRLGTQLGNPMASLAEWADKSGGVFAGYPRMTLSVRRPDSNGKGSKVAKIVLRIAVPTLEVVSNSTLSGIAPAPTVAYVTQGEVSFLLPDRGSLQTRKDALAFVRNALSSTVLIDAVQDLAAPF